MKLAEIIYKVAIGSESIAALSAFLISNPIGWTSFGFIVAGVAGVTGLVELRNRIKSRKEEVVEEYLRTLFLNHLGKIQRAAEKIRLDEYDELDLSDLENHEASNPYIIFYRLLTTKFDSAERGIKTIESALQKNEKLTRQFTIFLVRHVSDIEKKLENASDDIASLRSEMVALDSKADMILEQTKSLPPLSTPLITTTRRYQYRFDYKLRQVPLFGREKELNELYVFLEDNSNFTWWITTGPGGFGKSRLALELVLDAQSCGWRAGFLSRLRDFKDWDRWKLDAPTLVVVDYASLRAEEIGKAIACLTERAPLLDYPLRFLLLERVCSDDDQWVKDLVEPGRSEIECSRFRQPLEIPPLEDDAIFKTMEYVVNNNSSQKSFIDEFYAQHDSIVEQISKNSPEYNRPLFCIFAAEAIAQKGVFAIREWNPEDLSKWVLEREISRWKKTEVPEDHINLLVFATLCGGVNRTSAYELAKHTPELPEKRSFDERFYSNTCGYTKPDETDSLTPLEPDILGEFFVLERLAGRFSFAHNKDITKESTQKLLHLCWQFAPGKIVDFITRCYQDFPGHDELETIAQKPNEGHEFWPLLVAALIGIANESDLNMLATLVSQLRKDANTKHEKFFLAEALLARASRYYLLSKWNESLADCVAVIKMPELTAEQKAMAFFNRATVYHELGKTEEETNDYTTVINSPDTPAFIVARSLYNRAVLKTGSGDNSCVISDYTAIIDMANAPIEYKIKALQNRAVANNTEPATLQIRDYTSIIDMPDATAEQKAMALCNRGIVYRDKLDKFAEAISDFDHVVNMPRVSANQKAIAHNNLGIIYREKLGDPQKAMEEFNAVLKLSFVPSKQTAFALQALAHGRNENTSVGIAEQADDYDAILALKDLSSHHKALALLGRGSVYDKQGDIEQGIATYTQVTNMSGIDDEILAMALLQLAQDYISLSKYPEAINKCTVALEIHDQPVEQKAMLLLVNAEAKKKSGDFNGAITEYTTVINLSEVPPCALAVAHLARGEIFSELRKCDKAINDFVAVIELPDLPDEITQRAAQLLKEEQD